MRAAIYEEQGPADRVLRLVELPEPTPGAGEVLVRVHASGVNPADWKARAGSRGDPMPFPLIVPHHDGAGVIEAVGAGVPDRTGERVWLHNAQFRRARGTAADLVALPAALATTLPASISFAQGACLGIPALTSAQAVRLARLERDQTVLVAGGAGAVANVAIRLAKLAGAAVAATVSSPEKAGRARTAGADVALDRRSPALAEELRRWSGGRGVDAVIELDLAANAHLLPAIVRPHGRVVMYGNGGPEATIPALWLMRNSVALLPFLVFDLATADRTACIRRICSLLEHGLLPEDVGAALPLERIADAHRMGEEGRHLGNIVLELVGGPDQNPA